MSKNELKNIVILTMEQLERDGILDCNQYQGNDFNNLLTQIIETGRLEIE